MSRLPSVRPPCVVLALLAVGLVLGGCGGGSSGGADKTVIVSNPELGSTASDRDDSGDDNAAQGPGRGGGGGGGGLGAGPPGTSAGPGNGSGFVVNNGPAGGFINGINVPVVLQFNQPVDPTTVNEDTIQVVTIFDVSGVTSAAAGIVPQVTYTVNGNIVNIVPTLEFSPEEVTFGFVADALFEISFADANTGSVVRSTGGAALSNTGITYFFRTPDGPFDYQPGFPSVRAFRVDDVDPSQITVETITDTDQDGNLVNETLAFFGIPPAAIPAVEITSDLPPDIVPIDPIFEALFIFNDALIPTSVINPANNTSPQISITYNSAAVPAFVPKTIPAELTFVHQQANLTVVGWRSTFSALPPTNLLEVRVGAGVLDLAGNSKLSLTGNGAPALSAILVTEDGIGGGDYSFVEHFTDTSGVDSLLNTARWSTPFPSLLAPVLGGGSGTDRRFVIDTQGTAADPRETHVPLGTQLDFSAKVARLPTVTEVRPGVFEPRAYHFDQFSVPADWTLKPLFDRDGDGELDEEEFLVVSPDHRLDQLGAPFSLLCTDTLQVAATIDVTGLAAEALVTPFGAGDPDFAAYTGLGGRGAAAIFAGGQGGDGGDTLLQLDGGGVALPLQSPSAFPAFQASDGKLVGVTGRSSGIGATTLTDPLNDLSVINDDPGLAQLLAEGRLLLQPNVGTGSSVAGNSGSANQSIDENHPSYVIESVDVVLGETTITVRSDPGDPTLNQASDNIGKPPVSAAGDSYVVGRLAGDAGGDPSALQRQGTGAAPYVVVNEGALGITTTGGGGGGGGAYGAGSDGSDDGPPSLPNVNQRGGSGGISLDESAGAQGGLPAVRATGMVTSSTTIAVVTQLEGRSLSELVDLPGGSPLAGHALLLDAAGSAAEDGWLFTVSAFDGTTITLERIQVDTLDIGLIDGTTGFAPAGPLLSPGASVEFVLLPGLEVGGAGGGGTGVSVTGTLNYAPNVLPRFTPGAGGGAGGGELELESADVVRVLTGGTLLARGGRGGDVESLLGGFAGGGGGGGGNVVLRGRDGVVLQPGSLVSVLGGAGGGLVGAGQGGQGGPGYIRFESDADDLQLDLLDDTTEPPITTASLGRTITEPHGLGVSQFMQAEVANPSYTGVLVEYVAETSPADGSAVELSWAFTDAGIVGADHERPPFRVLFNSVPATAAGFLDLGAVDIGWFPAYDLVSGRTGFAYDALNDVILYARGRETFEIEVLDPASLLPVAVPLALPLELGDSFAPFDLLSMGFSPEFGGEIFLLERLTGTVYVLERDTGALRRRIVLPFGLQGAVAYLPADRLVLADNIHDRLVIVPTIDPLAADPLTADVVVLEPELFVPVERSGEVLDIEFTGLAWDAAAGALWAVDALYGRLLQVDMTGGNEGQSVPAMHVSTRLEDNLGQGVVPSSIAFDGSSLFLVHATKASDTRAKILDLGDVTEPVLSLDDFGTLLPEGSRSMLDSDTFLRFRFEFTGTPRNSPVVFDRVRVDQIIVSYENLPF